VYYFVGNARRMGRRSNYRDGSSVEECVEGCDDCVVICVIVSSVFSGANPEFNSLCFTVLFSNYIFPIQYFSRLPKSERRTDGDVALDLLCLFLCHFA
jgi:hypothetical protein